ncbi:hypothetical protein CBM2586_A110012 [Cupriavidus phytorum]|uniref:Uncharacterized protein n=1 Tax=Cupriavidus taiwanensis TaxID=164546 RepID=A0A375C009_9BURK|nr:hypothetical protein CBM2586_A110012 [Cupriavidus taiwanensis]
MGHLCDSVQYAPSSGATPASVASARLSGAAHGGHGCDVRQYLAETLDAPHADAACPLRDLPANASDPPGKPLSPHPPAPAAAQQCPTPSPPSFPNST